MNILHMAALATAPDAVLSRNLQIIQNILLLAIPVLLLVGIGGLVVNKLSDYQRTDNRALVMGAIGGLASMLGLYGFPISLAVSFIFNSLANPFI